MTRNLKFEYRPFQGTSTVTYAKMGADTTPMVFTMLLDLILDMEANLDLQSKMLDEFKAAGKTDTGNVKSYLDFLTGCIKKITIKRDLSVKQLELIVRTFKHCGYEPPEFVEADATPVNESVQSIFR